MFCVYKEYKWEFLTAIIPCVDVLLLGDGGVSVPEEKRRFQEQSQYSHNSTAGRNFFLLPSNISSCFFLSASFSFSLIPPSFLPSTFSFYLIFFLPLFHPSSLSLFLDAPSHLYMRVCPSVRPSVGPSVGPSVPRYFQTRTRRILCRVSGLVFYDVL